MNEVQALAALSHPNIVQFYEAWFEKSDGHLYFSMEYCKGRDLEYFMKNAKRKSSSSSSMWPLPESWLVSWFQQILSALNYMAAHRVIHRDIKLNNIFLLLTSSNTNHNNNINSNNSKCRWS